MKYLSQVTKAWTVIGMDLIGRLRETPRNNKYILSMTDLYTKWVAVAPLTSKTACEVAAALVKKMYSYGMGRKIITDQRKEFVNEVKSSSTVSLFWFSWWWPIPSLPFNSIPFFFY